MNKQNVDPTLKALQNQYNAILVAGSNIFDLQVELDNPRDIFYRPLYVAEKLFEQGYHVMRYSRAGGLSIHRFSQIKNKAELDSVFKKMGITNLIGNNSVSPTEVIEIFRAFKHMASIKHSTPFAFIIDYIPHLVSNQSPTVEERIVAESINDMASLPSVKKSGNAIIVYSHEEGNLSSLLKGLYKVNYGYPTIQEYEHFIEILGGRPDDYATTKVDNKTLANLSRGLNLNQIASIFKEAKAQHKEVTVHEIISEKERLIEQVSENTLNVLSTDITFDDLAGMEVPKRIFLDFAEKLKNQDPASPKAILAAGPPGTGKSALASAFANACGFNLVELSDQIKSMWVGESESRLNLALNLIEALSPVVLFIDEFDQSFSNRSQANHDGGVSSHYLKTLMKWLGDDSKRGQIVIYACSNTPQLLDPAMLNRFVTVPLLEATPFEMANIFPKIEKRIVGEERLNPHSPELIEGCNLLFSKGASPRQIFNVINHAISKFGKRYSESDILEVCRLFRTNGDPNSGAYSSLSALNLTAFDDYFPWWDNKEDYNYPWYLENIVDKSTGRINELELSKKINDLATKSKF